jgi:hypothetical protein
MSVTQKNSKKCGADNPTPKTGEKTKKQKIADESERWEQNFAYRSSHIVALTEFR